MQDNNKAITSLVRSMKRTLKDKHGIDVPHSALRASYLLALGENPHAFAGREQAAESKKNVPAAPTQLRTLYLADDSSGCLERFALDADGTILLPEGFEFRNTKLERQFAELPRVSRYGLPDYLAKAEKFYAPYGLVLSDTHDFEFKDLGDDSGDSCKVQLSMPDAEWQRILLAALAENQSFIDEVCEWVGLHYSRNFDTEPMLKKLEWAERYLESVEENARRVDVMFEWVYPDEDSGNVEAYVDLDSGEIVLAQEVPSDIMHDSVQLRIWVPNEGDDLEDAWAGEMYDVDFKRDKSGKNIFYIHYPSIARICQEYGISL